jgi:uncharacterized iron-regulated protein
MSGAEAGRLYEADGRPIALEAAAARLADAEVVLVGELHGNPAVHRLERRLAEELHRLHGRRLVLGAEMFEADDQLVLDEYLAGLILHHHLTSESKAWENYESDYRPLVELAKAEGLPFVATNVPRRYANLVAREGLGALERLGEEARRYVAPLPIRFDLDVPGYRELLEMDLPMRRGMKMAPENLVAAQAVKDATMAHFIARHAGQGRPLLHFNGVYHSQRRGGICWFLERDAPGLRVVTVSSVLGDPAAFEDDHRGAGELVFVAPAA